MTVLKPIRRLTDAEVSRGDVIRWGKDARWVIVCETDQGPQGHLARLRWAFGKDRGSWVPSEPGAIEGWERLDQNEHTLYRRDGKHSAKHRANAEQDATAVLGYKADGWYA